MFDGQALHYIAWKQEWRAHHQENYPGLQEDALKRVLVDIALGRVARRVRYKANVDQVWEPLDWSSYLRQDTFLHDLTNPVYAVRDISDNNYRALEEYLDMLFRPKAGQVVDPCREVQHPGPATEFR